MEFSVIVPAYNTGSFLHVCVASVQGQSVSDWELIVVDDGSTDDTAAILDSYADADARIRVFHQANRGQFFARQRGIDAARGEYIVFLDSDDELAPECLETLRTAIRKEPWDMIVYTGRIIQNGSDTGRVIGSLSDQEERIPAARIKESLIASNSLNSLCLKAFRRDLFSGDDTDYAALEGTHCGEDKVRLLYPVTKAASILYIPDCLYRYHHRTDSTMHRFEEDTVARMFAWNMFSMLRLYMAKWNMDDLPHREQAAAYQVRTYLSVYYGFRKRCTTAQEKRKFRRYPWKTYWGQLAPYCRLAKRRLSLRDRIKLYIARMQL